MVNALKTDDPYVKTKIFDSQCLSLEAFLDGIDLVVIMVKHNEIIENIDKIKGKVVLDCQNICKFDGVYHI